MMNLMDAMRLAGTKKKTKILRGDTAKKVLERVSMKDNPKKDRSQAERRKAIYGSDK